MTEKRKRTVIVKNRDDQYTIQIHTKKKRKEKSFRNGRCDFMVKGTKSIKKKRQKTEGGKASEMISSEYQSINELV